MAVTRFHLANLLFSAVLTCGVMVAPAPQAAAGQENTPVIWYEDDRRGIDMPAEHNPKETLTVYDEVFARPTDRFFHPTRFLRRIGSWAGGDMARPAANVNALDEVPNSSWFTNRIGLQEFSPLDCATGVGLGGPDPSSTWRVLGAKTDGVTPGFRIADANGEPFLLKLDPAEHVGTTVRAGVIAARILHACGYNVPCDHAVTFGPDDLTIEGEVYYRRLGGERVPLRTDNLETILGPPHTSDGKWVALASRFLDGVPLGPFDYKGRRKDDPNDRIDHEDRRELRGLRVISAWIHHFDSKRDNTLDVYVGEPGQGHVKHYLIDFASTMGSGGSGPSRKWGWEYGIDMPAVTGRTLSLGFHEDRWVAQQRPAGLAEVGYYDNRFFDPVEWKPIRPNSAFANLTDRDGYWAAKIITAFTDAHLEAIVRQAQYADPAAEEFMIKALAERRDIIGRYWFSRVAPLDFFARQGDALVFRDLGAERGLFPAATTSYRGRWRLAQGGEWSQWMDSKAPAVELSGAAAGSGRPLLVQTQVSRGDGWSGTTEVQVAADGRVTALER